LYERNRTDDLGGEFVQDDGQVASLVGAPIGPVRWVAPVVLFGLAHAVDDVADREPQFAYAPSRVPGQR